MDPLDKKTIIQPQNISKETDNPPQNLPSDYPICNKSDAPPQPLSFDHLLSTKIQIGPYQYLIALMVCMFPPAPPSNFI